MDKDSQRGSVLSRDNLKKVRKSGDFTPEEVEVMNKVFERLGLASVEDYKKNFEFE